MQFLQFPRWITGTNRPPPLLHSLNNRPRSADLQGNVFLKKVNNSISHFSSPSFLTSEFDIKIRVKMNRIFHSSVKKGGVKKSDLGHYDFDLRPLA